MTLTEFLLARLAEDEAAARSATGSTWLSVVDTPDDDDHVGSIYADGNWDAWVGNWDNGSANGDHIARHDPARVLADVEAKRRIVELHTPDLGLCRTCSMPSGVEMFDSRSCPTLAALALPYADHPDYQEAWKP